MKVNMTPNPLDVVTIHASQGDTEARQWEFELHNNGELIDTSEITEQLFFKSYKGGTEQLLPENTSTPTTSPFIGDIKYPQGLLTDQEFTYRQSPTEEDGLAKITDIKGNTLNWNQLELNDLTTATTRGVTFTKNSDGSWTTSGTATTFAQKNFSSTHINTIVGHKYLFIGGAKGGSNTTYSLRPYMNGTGQGAENRDYGNGVIIEATTTDEAYGTMAFQAGINADGLVWHPQIFDLSEMFGIGNEPTIEEFKSLFSLPYYAYNQGSLLSFNGNGIKTVGKNLASGISQGAVDIHGGTTSNEKRLRVDGFVRVFQGEHYTFTATSNSGKTLQIYTRYFADADGSEQVSYLDWLNLPRSIIIPIGVNYATFTIRFGNNDNITLNDVSDVQIEHGTSATEYEPYTSSTLSLPISTYFPNGMKSAGNVYDELTESKAITRVGEVDVPISSSSWAIHGTDRFYLNGWLPNNIATDKNANLENNKGLAVQDLSNEYGSYMWFGYNGLYLNRISSTETIAEMQTRLSGLKLYYELATPTETSFTTASLVTENAEIPLSNNDGVLIGKCTEELSAEPGFHDAKIKLSDSDGTCYSNKLQLHVERSPQ